MGKLRHRCWGPGAAAIWTQEQDAWVTGLNHYRHCQGALRTWVRQEGLCSDHIMPLWSPAPSSPCFPNLPTSQSQHHGPTIMASSLCRAPLNLQQKPIQPTQNQACKPLAKVTHSVSIVNWELNVSKMSNSDFLMLIPRLTVILLTVGKQQLYLKGLFHQRIFLMFDETGAYLFSLFWDLGP